MADTRDICVVDVETSGLDPLRHRVIEVAAVRLTHDLREVDAFESRVFLAPSDFIRAEAEALAINGYDRERWRDAPRFGEIAGRLRGLLDGSVAGGWNVWFDLSFLLAEFARAGTTDPRIARHRIDVSSLAWLLPLPKHGLREACDFFGISNDGAHSAMADVRRTIAVMGAIRERAAFAGPCG